MERKVVGGLKKQDGSEAAQMEHEVMEDTCEELLSDEFNALSEQIFR